jgi:uncharacterized membrane protein
MAFNICLHAYFLSVFLYRLAHKFATFIRTIVYEIVCVSNDPMIFATHDFQNNLLIELVVFKLSILSDTNDCT